MLPKDISKILLLWGNKIFALLLCYIIYSSTWSQGCSKKQKDALFKYPVVFKSWKPSTQQYANKTVSINLSSSKLNLIFYFEVHSFIRPGFIFPVLSCPNISFADVSRSWSTSWANMLCTAVLLIFMFFKEIREWKTLTINSVCFCNTEKNMFYK